MEAITAEAPADAEPKMLADVVAAALLTVALTRGSAWATTVTSPVASTTLSRMVASTSKESGAVPATWASMRTSMMPRARLAME